MSKLAFAWLIIILSGAYGLFSLIDGAAKGNHNNQIILGLLILTSWLSAVVWAIGTVLTSF
jgi:hypothetical protein